MRGHAMSNNAHEHQHNLGTQSMMPQLSKSPITRCYYPNIQHDYHQFPTIQCPITENQAIPLIPAIEPINLNIVQFNPIIP